MAAGNHLFFGISENFLKIVKTIGADEDNMVGVLEASNPALTEHVILVERRLIATKVSSKTYVYQAC